MYGSIKKAYIRPVYVGDSLRIKSYALTRTNDKPLQDSDIIFHCDPDYTGRMIKDTALEFWGIEEANIEWGNALVVDATPVLNCTILRV
jgi:hypothetical protein